MKKRLNTLILIFASAAAQADFWDEWRACTTEPGVFLGVEPSELIRNDFKKFAGEIGYKFNADLQVRLTLMDFNVGNSNYIGDYGAEVATGGHIDWRSRGVELHIDNFITPHWYYSFTAGRYHDSFAHDIFADQQLEHHSNTLGVGIGFQYRDVFKVKNLYMNFDIPIRVYLDPIKEARLGSSTLRERTWSGNGWLLLGYQF